MSNESLYTLYLSSIDRTLLVKPLQAQSLCLVCESIDKRATAHFQHSSSLQGKLDLESRSIYGILGFVQIESGVFLEMWINCQDIFLGVVTQVQHVGRVLKANVNRVSQVGFYSLLSPKYDHFAELTSDNSDPPLLHPCAPLIKLLTSGSFYFSNQLDLTRSLQTMALGQYSTDTGDAHFIWNQAMLSDLLKVRFLAL